MWSECRWVRKATFKFVDSSSGVPFSAARRTTPRPKVHEVGSFAHHTMAVAGPERSG